MSLFFESSQQSVGFLMSLPIGFFMAFGLGGNPAHHWRKILLDSLVLTMGAGLLLCLLVLCQETVLRSYHLLGMFCGALLYMLGFYRLQKAIKATMKRKLLQKQKRQQEKASTKTKIKGE